MNDQLPPIRVTLSSAPHTTASCNNAKHLQRQTRDGGLRITPRDRTLLLAMARHRFLTADQVQRLVFQASMSRTRRRLRQLYDHGYLDRIPVVPEPTYNIPSFVYQLTKRGLEIIDDELDMPHGVKGLDDAGLRFVRHHCLLTEVYIALRQSCQQRSLTVNRWLDEYQLKHVLGEPPKVAVRHELLGQATNELSYLPDGLFSLVFPNGRSLIFFVEIDLSTHAQRHWVERALVFSQYAAPQGWLSQRLQRSCRLLIITKPDFRRRSRCANVLQSIHRAVGSSQYFLATTLDNVIAPRVLTSVWRMPGQEQTYSLLPQTPMNMPTRVRVASPVTASG